MQEVSASVISNEVLVQNGIAFAADEEQLLWPAARDFIDGLQHGRKCVFCHLESVQV